ncbi:hypothetical protein DKX38_020191 [Salix brachista]|uniref:Uncharacterized protein n=1 Tax=Salix brachista TaxID=2182728 RepID=A0A5N5KII3_9ROSI|nr:hypothetical protein DKX38_020191 [Salix brachista]
MLKRAVNVGRGWKPDPILVNTCLEYLEGQGDTEEMKEFIRMDSLIVINSLRILHYYRCNSLIVGRDMLVTGKSVNDVLYQLKMDGIAADEETLKILGTLIKKISCQVYSIMQLAGQVNFKAVTNDPGALNRRSDSIMH